MNFYKTHLLTHLEYSIEKYSIKIYKKNISLFIMGTSISQDKDKASPSFYPDETDNSLKNENTSCFVEQNSPDNDKNYNYAAIDLNLSNQEKLTLKTNSKMRKTVINDFINKYDLHYEERKNIIEQKTAEQKNNQTIRSNIRVLIIVASNPEDETSDFFENFM